MWTSVRPGIDPGGARKYPLCPPTAADFRLERLQPFGAVVHGLPNLAGHRPTARVLARLADAAAEHGHLVFRNQSLPGTALRAVSEYFGGLAAEHTCHAAAAHCDILRLSNREEHGVVRVGPQWHADGSFERRGSSRTCSSTRRPCPASAAGPRCPTSPPPLTPCPQRSGRRGAGWRLSTPTPAPSTRSSTSTLAQAAGRSLSTSARRAAAPERRGRRPAARREEETFWGRECRRRRALADRPSAPGGHPPPRRIPASPPPRPRGDGPGRRAERRARTPAAGPRGGTPAREAAGGAALVGAAPRAPHLPPARPAPPRRPRSVAPRRARRAARTTRPPRPACACSTAPRCEAGTRSTRRPSLCSRPSRTSGARVPPAWARAAACGRLPTTGAWASAGTRRRP